MRRLFGLAGAFSLAWVICVALNAAAVADDQPPASPKACTLTRIASLDMTVLPNGMITVPVVVAGKPRNFIVSLQASSAISDALATELNLRRNLRLRGAGGHFSMVMLGLPVYGRVLVPDMQIGSARSTNVDMFVVGAYPSGRTAPLPGGDSVAGVLGTTLLQDFDAEFDFKANKLNLYAPTHCNGAAVYWDTSPAAVPFEFDNSGDLQFHMQLDGKDVTVKPVLDSLEARMGMTPAQTIFGIQEGSPGLQQVTVGKSTTYRYPFKNLNIDSLTINNPDIRIYPDLASYQCRGKKFANHICWGGSDVRIGLYELGQLHLYFAFQEKKLYLAAGGRSWRHELAPIPLSLSCGGSAATATFVMDGPEGHATATMRFAINSAAAPDAMKVAPGSDAVCTVSAKPGVTIASASFDIDKDGPTAESVPEFLKHVDITEAANDAGGGSRSYMFTVKAKDTTPGTLTLEFPVAYRGQP